MRESSGLKVGIFSPSHYITVDTNTDGVHEARVCDRDGVLKEDMLHLDGRLDVWSLRLVRTLHLKYLSIRILTYITRKLGSIASLLALLCLIHATRVLHLICNWYAFSAAAQPCTTAAYHHLRQDL